MQHQLTKIIFRFRKLSAVKIFPKDAVQRKKATLGGAFGFQIAFQGNPTTTLGSKPLYYLLTEKVCFPEGPQRRVSVPVPFACVE
jgi:hypothetical protein